MRATDARYSNDSSEIEWGLKILKEKLFERGVDKNVVERFVESLRKGIKDRIRGIFLTCFSGIEDEYSEENGVLSQWRGYGLYAIRFKREELEKLISKEPELKDQLIIADFDEGVRYLGHESEKSKQESKNLRNNFGIDIDSLVNAANSNGNFLKYEEKDFREIIKNICICFVLSKHIGFKEELEKRAAFIIWKNDDEEVTEIFCEKQYIERFTNIKTVIDKVIIGPMSDSEYEESKKLLLEYGISLSRSSTPFLKK